MLKKIVFMGTPEFAVPSLEALKKSNNNIISQLNSMFHDNKVYELSYKIHVEGESLYDIYGETFDLRIDKFKINEILIPNFQY